jgi:hypothetical protein
MSLDTPIPPAPYDHGATANQDTTMLSDLSAYILAHAPDLMLGDAGIVILCAGTLATAYLWAYAQRKGAI